MNTCGLTRLLVPAFLMGLAVSSATGNEVLAWLAVGVTALLAHLVGRLDSTPAICPVPVSTGRGHPTDPHRSATSGRPTKG